MSKDKLEEKHNCDILICYHNNTKGLCCLYNPDNCKYRQLQKENAELKELLKQWLQTSKASGCDNINIVTDTEQFLSEVKK